MSVTAVNQIDSTCTESDDGTIEYDVTLEAITDAISDGPRTVLAHASVPKRGATYAFGGDTDGYASCRSRSLSYRSKDETRRLWAIKLKYSTKGSSQNPTDSAGGTPTDPIDWSWKCSGDTWQRLQAPDFDRNGRALANVVGEPFLPPPENELHHPLITLTKNHPTLSLTVWSEAQGKVNSTPTWGLDARRIKLREWRFTEHWIGQDVMYFSNTLVVEIKPDGFFFQPPNMGHREFIGVDPATGKPKHRVIVDDMKIPVARPVSLDAFGSQLPNGSPVLHFDQAAGALQKFELEDEYDFRGNDVLPLTLPGNFIVTF